MGKFIYFLLFGGHFGSHLGFSFGLPLQFHSVHSLATLYKISCFYLLRKRNVAKPPHYWQFTHFEDAVQIFLRVDLFNRPTICTHLMMTFAGTIDMIIPLATEGLLMVWYVRSNFTSFEANVYFHWQPVQLEGYNSCLLKNVFTVFISKETLLYRQLEILYLPTIQEFCHLSYHTGSLRLLAL